MANDVQVDILLITEGLHLFSQAVDLAEGNEGEIFIFQLVNFHFYPYNYMRAFGNSLPANLPKSLP
jgi:hypothetical protein